jgi:hypothetical protein
MLASNKITGDDKATDGWPRYLNNAAIADALGSLPLKSGIGAMLDNIAACYKQPNEAERSERDATDQNVVR